MIFDGEKENLSGKKIYIIFAMKQAEIALVNHGEGCTIYTIQFLKDMDSEFEKFVSKFKDDAEFNPDFQKIIAILSKIAGEGAFERYFRIEGTPHDRVVALPILQSKLRLYCLRLSDKILILGNGGIKATRTYQEDPMLRGYVLTLQKFDQLLKDGVANGSIEVTENTIETDNIFEL